jgi:soluble lytic murein transglycosylase-like protein
MNNKYAYILSLAIAISAVKAASAADIDMNIIKQIESSGRPYVTGKAGERGLYQITKAVLHEYNRCHRVKYSQQDMYTARANTTVATWYIEKRIPEMLRIYHRPVTQKNIIIAYNAGIKAVVEGYIPVKTQKYIKKYQKSLDAQKEAGI